MVSNSLTLFLRCSALLHEGTEQADSQLLEAFLRDRDILALEALVRRHAPMVWGVCRRTLADLHEAEDAFQATFLVLLRKAASIRTRELLPNWLYHVAYKTACKARQRAAKRGSREKQVRVLPEPPMEPHDDTFGPELRALLDEELGRLPEKYRIAVVLCDVEGRKRHEAARQLRLPEGTVASRLATGRALLAKRLLRRGLSVSATCLAATGFQQAASAALPAALLTNTVNAVRLLAAGQTVAAGLISTAASPLAEGALRAMAVAKLKTAGVWLVLAALVMAGGMVTYHALAAARTPLDPASRALAPLPSRLTRVGEVRKFVGHTGDAHCVAYSRDGRYAVSSSGWPIGDRTIRLWDVSTGKQIRQFNPSDGLVFCAVFSPDGRHVLYGADRGAVAILDATTGMNVRRFQGIGDSDTGKELCKFEGHKHRIMAAVFSPDGKRAASGAMNDTLYLWDVKTGEKVQSFEGNKGGVHAVAISPDGRYVLSGSWEEKQPVRLWDIATGKLVREFIGHEGRVPRVAFSHDGCRVISGSSDKTVRLWDVATGRELHCFTGHTDMVWGVAFSPDDRFALSASQCRSASARSSIPAASAFPLSVGFVVRSLEI